MPRRFRCTVCGYVHEGDAPPDCCPVCGVGADMFEPDEDAPAASVTTPLSASEIAPSDETRAGPRLLILGGGIAALSAAQAARAASSVARITLVHREPTLPYDRMSLTRYVAGDVARETLLLRRREWFEEQQISLVQAEARSLGRAKRRIVLEDGQELPYDRLLIATGAHPFVPSIPGVRRQGVHVLRTLDDADAILHLVRKGARCVCIGGGLLGIETAGGLVRRGAAVTVLDEAPWLLSRQLARTASARLAGLLGEVGIAVVSAAKVAEIVGDESVRSVLLADGTEVPADVVVIAAGVRPNVGMARAAGLATNRGVLVDDSLRTNDPDVLAAGDVAEHRGVVWGLWTVALEQGKLAGAGLTGAPIAFAGNPPSTQLKVLAWPVFSVGRFEVESPSDKVIEQADKTRLARIIVHDGVVVGGNLVGDATLAGPLRRAVQERLALATVAELAALEQGGA
jgi:nitrite reductase (NADH) large subunit